MDSFIYEYPEIVKTFLIIYKTLQNTPNNVYIQIAEKKLKNLRSKTLQNTSNNMYVEIVEKKLKILRS